MSFCIMRMAKVKSRVSLVRAAQHNTRERMPPNADQARSEQNVAIGGMAENVIKRYSEQLPAKVRKNAVHAVELIFTASPDFSGSWDQYLEACGKWTADLFGQKNILHIARHKDELTPHAHILVMPLKDGKLNANHFIGGSRNRMAELQDEFFDKVGKQHGLDRGRSREETRARHTPHTLAAAAAELEGKKKILQEAVKATQINPLEIREMKARLANLDRQTPDSLRQQASLIEKKGFKTVGEYRKSREQEKAIQQSRSQGRSR